MDLKKSGKRIKEMRLKRGYSGAKLAELCDGYSSESGRSKVSRWEKGNGLDLENIQRLASALECTPEYLLGCIDHPDITTSWIAEQIPLSREAIEALEKLGDNLNEYSENDSVLVTSILNDLIINFIESISTPMSIDLSTLLDGEKFDGYDVQVIEKGLFTDASEMLTACETVSDFLHSDIPKVTPAEYQYAKLAIRGIRTSIGDRLSDIVTKTVLRLAESSQLKDLEV